MPDGTSRFKCRGQTIHHFMGCSTFSQYTVVHKYSVVAITDKARLDRACLLGCGLTTGYGAATKTANVQEGETVAVFGLGAVGLAVVQGAVSRKASKIIAIDTNEEKKSWATKFGATDFVNPAKLPEGKGIVEYLTEITDGGLDHTLYVELQLIGHGTLGRKLTKLCSPQRLHWKRQRDAPGARGLPQG